MTFRRTKLPIVAAGISCLGMLGLGSRDNQVTLTTKVDLVSATVLSASTLRVCVSVPEGAQRFTGVQISGESAQAHLSRGAADCGECTAVRPSKARQLDAVYVPGSAGATCELVAPDFRRGRLWITNAVGVCMITRNKSSMSLCSGGVMM